MSDAPAESELESFRQRWREEVSSRPKPTAPTQTYNKPASSEPARSLGHYWLPAENAPRPNEGGEGRAYHDIEEKEHYLSLKHASEREKGLGSSEPTSALEHYEQAVERETQGNLGDSISLYRRAFKVRRTITWPVSRLMSTTA